ncbi:MAG: TetR/AcrR family transcriptional regulator [Rubricella sp.]
MTTKAKPPKKGHYHHGDLRAALVQATRELVEEHGPEGFSVAQACRIAGVSTAAPYRHFDTKQDMLDAVAEDGMERMEAKMARYAAAHPPGTLDAVSAIGKAYVDFAIEEQGVFRLMFTEFRNSARQEDLAAKGRRCKMIVDREVARHLDRDPNDPEVFRVSMMLWTIVHGLSFLAIDGKLGVMDMPIDLDAMIRETGARILGVRA